MRNYEVGDGSLFYVSVVGKPTASVDSTSRWNVAQLFTTEYAPSAAAYMSTQAHWLPVRLHSARLSDEETTIADLLPEKWQELAMFVMKIVDLFFFLSWKKD